MPAFLVEASRSGACTRVDDVDSAVVFAADSSTAKKMMQAKYGGDADAVWNAATVTQIVAATDWIGWVFGIKLLSPSGTLVASANLTATGAPQDTMDEIGAALVTALGTTGITPAYNAGSNTLSVAVSGDNKGDHTLLVTIKPPAAQNVGDVNISDLVGTITHQGAANAAVTVVLPADAAVIPLVLRTLKAS